MLGGVEPDLSEIPCPACDELVDPNDVVWDGWHKGDQRFSALPYHRACAESAGILPPAEPTDAMRACERCALTIEPAMLATALEALHARFRRAKGSLANPDVVWRLAQRDPRVYRPEHFACVLEAVSRSRKSKPS